METAIFYSGLQSAFDRRANLRLATKGNAGG